MSSRAEIRIDFQQAMRQADRLDEIAKKLERVSKNSMEDSMQNLSSAWKGNNASAFLRKEEHLQKDIYVTAGNIREIADDIRQIAGRIYEAEMAAWRIANERRS